MNNFETTQNIEKRFEQDRVEKAHDPGSPRAINSLRTARSDPVKGLPRTGPLVRSLTSTLTSHFDHGLMDIWVDDGTSGNISSTVRNIRFSTAASAIDGLFHSPIRNMQNEAMLKQEILARAHVTLASKPLRSLESDGHGTSEAEAKSKAKELGNSDRSSENGARTSEKDSDAETERASVIEKPVSVLETEQVTPSARDGKETGEVVDAPSQAPKTPSDHATPQMKRKASNFSSKRDEKPGIRATSQSSSDQQQEKVAKRRSKLNKANIFKRLSARAGNTPPSPAFDSVNPEENMEQTDLKGAANALLIFKRRSSVVHPLSFDAEGSLEHDTSGSNEPDIPLRKSVPSKLTNLVKKLSSGLRQRRNPAQSMKSDFEERAQNPEGDRKKLFGLFERFSSDSTEGRCNGHESDEEDAGAEVPNRVAFFLNLFRKRSSDSTEKKSEPEMRPHEQHNDADQPESSSSPLREGEKWWSELSEKVTRFLIMLVD